MEISRWRIDLFMDLLRRLDRGGCSTNCLLNNLAHLVGELSVVLSKVIATLSLVLEGLVNDLTVVQSFLAP